MINLLPPALKDNYGYARRNGRLLTWIFAFVAGLCGVVLITSVGLFTINNSINSYKSRITTTQHQLTKANSVATEQQVAGISSNLKLMVDVLSKEVLFSKLLAQLGSITPPNVILTNLSIAQNQSAIAITAQTVDYNAATQLQINLSDPSNKIFSKADLVSISCTPSQDATNRNYPCSADIQAQFTSSNPFLFINASSNQKAGT
jgi:Tfp pilus assembly protein PilN